MRIRRVVVSLGLAFALACASVAQADEIKVLSSNNLRTTMEELIPQFERETGHKVNVEFGLAAVFHQRIEKGEAVDATFLTSGQIDSLVSAGKLTGASRTPLARLGVAIGILTGGRKFDISTVDAFKRSLLDARGVVYASQGTSGIYFAGLIKKLGLTDTHAANFIPAASAAAAEQVLLSRKAELVVLPASEILPIHGAEVLGLLPEEVQQYNTMVGAVATGARGAAAARALLAFVTTPAARGIFKKRGLDAPGPAPAVALKVFSAGAMRTTLDELLPQFERETGYKIAAEFGTAVSLGRRIEQGEAFDLAIVTPTQMDAVVAQGKIAAGTRTPIARMGMALAIPSGGRRFDISTTEALKRSLTSAKSIAYPKEGSSGVYFVALVKRLGLEQTLAANGRPKAGGAAVGAAISSGEAELAVLPVSEILPLRGVEMLGPFPVEVQEYTQIVAGVGSAAGQGEVARKLLAFITSPASRALMVRKGLEQSQ